MNENINDETNLHDQCVLSDDGKILSGEDYDDEEESEEDD